MSDTEKNKTTHLHPSSNRKNIKLAILGVVVMTGLIFGAVVVGKIIDHHAVNDPYCESVDPTGCEADVTIHNDTASTYTVKQCMDDNVPCNKFADTRTLSQGMNEGANGSTDDTPQVWVIYSSTDKVVGCLNLVFTKQYTNQPVTVLLSKMQTCSKVKAEVATFNKQNWVW